MSNPTELPDLCAKMVKLHDEHRTVLTIHMDEMKRLLEDRRAQPEGEAPQAVRASRPAEVDDEGLPGLPQHFGRFNIDGLDGHRIKGYTAEQYRQGQRDAVAAYKRQQVALQQLADQAQELDMGY